MHVVIPHLDVLVSTGCFFFHLAQLLNPVWRILLSEPSCLQDAWQVQDRFQFVQ